jgi:CHAD domain-containing protein
MLSMTAEIRADERGAKGARRILRKELEKALTSLQSSRVTDENVHDARKRIKKARAALRLLRDAIGKQTYARENGALRDVARPLSQVRDSKVLLDTLEKLNDQFANECRALCFDDLRRELNRERRKLRHEVLSAAKPLKSELATLRKVRADASQWHLDKQGWSVIGCGVKRIYGNARRALSAAERTGAPEDFHEWRKQTKYLRHQVEFLAPMWPGALSEVANELHKLSDDLGDEHDLTVLREKAQAHSAVLASHLDLVLALIDERRKELREEAIGRGRQLYEEKPREFTARLYGYWSNWHAS